MSALQTRFVSHSHLIVNTSRWECKRQYNYITSRKRVSSRCRRLNITPLRHMLFLISKHEADLGRGFVDQRWTELLWTLPMRQSRHEIDLDFFTPSTIEIIFLLTLGTRAFPNNFIFGCHGNERIHSTQELRCHNCTYNFKQIVNFFRSDFVIQLGDRYRPKWVRSYLLTPDPTITSRHLTLCLHDDRKSCRIQLTELLAMYTILYPDLVGLVMEYTACNVISQMCRVVQLAGQGFYVYPDRPIRRPALPCDGYNI